MTDFIRRDPYKVVREISRRPVGIPFVVERL